MNLDFDELSSGQPVKTNASKEEKTDSKFFRLGFQTSQLAAERQIHEKQVAQDGQQIAMAMQELMNAQARMAAQMGAAGGVQAGLQAGMGMAGMGPQGQPMGGPPMGGPPMGGAPMGAPGGAPPMDMMAGLPPGGPAPGGPQLPPGVGEFMGSFDQQMQPPPM